MRGGQHSNRYRKPFDPSRIIHAENINDELLAAKIRQRQRFWRDFVIAVWSAKDAESRRVKRYWEMIADDLKKAGWSWGCVSALDCEGRTIWIADAHRGDGKRFVVRADDRLTAFLT